MAETSIIGIDPGIIHTGCVRLTLDDSKRTVDVVWEVISGVDVSKVRDWVDTHQGPIFIEDYNPGNYGREDKKMSEALGRLKAAFPPADDPIVKYVDNAGINTLIPLAVLQTFGIAKFSVSTHHNDLVSAGKIALLGMIKENDGLRELASAVIRDAVAGDPWVVVKHA